MWLRSGDWVASGVNLITRTKTRTIALSRRDAARGSAAGQFIIVLEKLHRLVPNFVPILLFSYSPPLRPPSGYPLVNPSLVRWSIPYSILMRARTVTYHSMAVEIIYRFLLTFGDPYIICLYQLCYDCGGNSTACAASRSFATATVIDHTNFLINTYSPKQREILGSFKDCYGHP